MLQNDETAPKVAQGFLSFTLHAHLPWVVNHGTWPHGMEWLLEAAAETYLPLLRVLENLERDGIALRCNLNLSPILLEQLAHPAFQAEFPRYLERKISAAREDEAYFLSNHELAYAATARYWQRFYATGLEQFVALGGRIHEGFRSFHDSGAIEIITCGASHGYLPLLGTDESLRAQVRLAVSSHERHLGLTPRGMWIPECGYRPAGEWSYPVRRNDGAEFGPAFSRIGVEQALAESGLEYFLVDSHLIEEARGSAGRLRDHVASSPLERTAKDPHRRLYQPYEVEQPDGTAGRTVVFPRDPRTGHQVWSGENGYPGDPMYLDFHKKRWPGGHRYWRVTGAGVDIADKLAYDPDAAKERIHSHASHFIDLVWKTLEPAFTTGEPPIVSAPFDAELFGHWWFEGPQWLEEVARILHTQPTGLDLITGAEYLRRHKPIASISMPEGSWGAGGGHQVWLNSETEWTYRELYDAELTVRSLCAQRPAPDSDTDLATFQRVLKQLCRELLLLESSDWQFLITTGAARDYAEQRFRTHLAQFSELRFLLEAILRGESLGGEHYARLAAMEERDSIFPEIDPDLWCAGSRATDDLPCDTDASAISVDAAPPASPQPLVDGTLGELPKFLPQTEA